MTLSHISVAVMDDEFFSLRSLVSLFGRHPLVCIEFGCSRPQELFKGIEQADRPIDIILLDAEFEENDWTVARVIRHLSKISPHSRIVMNSQYSHEEMLHTTVEAGAIGFLHKADIGYGIVSAIRAACHTPYVYTPTLELRLRRHYRTWVEQGKMLPCWAMPDTLNRRQRQTLEGIYLDGLSPRTLASQLTVTPATISTYKYQGREQVFAAYDTGWYWDDPQLARLSGLLNLDELVALMLQGLPRESDMCYLPIAS